MRTHMRDALMREVQAAKALAEAAETEERSLTDVERDTITEHLAKAKAIEDEAKKEKALREQMAEFTKNLAMVNEFDTVGITRPAVETAAKAMQERSSIGAEFVESPEFKALIGSVPGGRFGEKTRVQSQPYGVKTLITGVSDTSAGALVQNDYRGLLSPFYARPLTVRDLVASGTTQSDTIEFVRLTSVTNNAAPVAEATSAAVIDGSTVTATAGGLKPESGMVFAKDTTTVKTIAHWIPATKRALSDASQVRTLIDAFLRYGLEEELEDQMVSGSGSGENFTGIANTSGVQTQAAPSGGQTILDTLRIARRKVRIGGRVNPTGYVVNPLDWETVELMKDANERYLGAGPFVQTTPTLWGLPVVESEAVPAGIAYCGAWNQAVLYDREQASIQVTDSHLDFFVRNLVVILAEMRAAFTVIRPSAFVKVTLA